MIFYLSTWSRENSRWFSWVNYPELELFVLYVHSIAFWGDFLILMNKEVNIS